MSLGVALMKYMGSKRSMLTNGLGKLLNREVAQSQRFIDLFAGSGVVANQIAQNHPIEVCAFDLQNYSAILANSVLARVKPLNAGKLWSDWLERSKEHLRKRYPGTPSDLTSTSVAELREWCSKQRDLPITRAYGGHYFSSEQAVWIDALRAGVSRREPERTVALAALVRSASACAAAPGHTAQPFQPTETAKRFLAEAWSRDVVVRVKLAFEAVASQCALVRGRATVRDANSAVKMVREGDLVFIDPPYSGVQYSRFYHVLESVAMGECGEVTGVGRYPSTELRPKSKYSYVSSSALVLEDLLAEISIRGAMAILTFPDHCCSNGLSGERVREIAQGVFSVREWNVESQFSSLGGTGSSLNTVPGRAARKHANELMLLLKPK